MNLFETAESCLAQLRREQEENRAFFGNAYQNEKGYVFTWEDGRLYDPDYVSRAFSKATKAFGRPEITFHKLRLNQNENDLSEISMAAKDLF